MHPFQAHCALLTFIAALSVTLPAQAAVDDEAEQPFKLTVGDYLYSGGYAGQDVNLRWRHEDTTVWAGDYRDRDVGNQARIGAEHKVALGQHVSLQGSLQAATHGFIGGSATVQTTDPWFVLAGWGRTNLKPYFNLNFDPNDAVTLGAGWQGEGGRKVSLTLITDDRLHTHQKNWHLLSQWPWTHRTKLTLDLLHKTGIGDGGAVNAWGASVGIDFPSWFLRLAHDPKQNFSVQDATRLSGGLRF